MDRRDARPDGVPSVVRAVRILEAVGNAARPPTLGELARTLGIPKSTTHDLCTTLVRERLLTRSPDGRFRLGVRVLELYRAYDAASDLSAAFAEVCDELLPRHEETLVLSVLDGREVVYVACRNGTQPIAVNYRIGLRLPAHCTATGKAILSELPDQRVRELFGNEPLPRPTRHSLGSLDELLRELEATRLRGYSLDDEETVEGMCCVGAAVRSRSDVRAGVAFSTVKARLTPERVDQLARQVVELARRLSQRLGAYP